jgi:hypothetical protein
LSTVTEDQSGADELANNPAGQVLIFLRQFQHLAGTIGITGTISRPSRRRGEAHESSMLTVLKRMDQPRSPRMIMGPRSVITELD